MTDIVLTVREVRGGRYDAHIDGRYLLTSGQPFCDGARALIAQGLDPSRHLVMRREGRDQDDLSARLGVAAGLTVGDDHGRPKLRKWSGPKTTVTAPSVDFLGPEAPEATPAPEIERRAA